jgi:predicted nuclease of predicted toxin-antitoxin system
MKILVDENIPAVTVTELREQGYDVLDIRGTGEQGMDDQHLWEKATQEQRLLVTTDKGFAEHREELHYGLLIIRLKQPSRDKIHQRVLQALQRYAADQWPGLMIVMRDSFQSSWKPHSKKGRI